MDKQEILLIVDETPEKRRFLKRTAQAFLDPREWEVIEADSLDGAMKAVDKFRARLGMAIVHASLSDNDPRAADGRRIYEGLQVLDRIAEVTAKLRPCYRILVSTFITDRKEFSDHTSVDDFVHMRYNGDRNPVDELQASLRRGIEHIENARLVGTKD